MDRSSSASAGGVATGVLPDQTWNQTERSYPDLLLHEAFAAQVARDPTAPAVRFRDERLTYAELDERVDRLAARLVASGVKPETLVAVCMERSTEMVVALHAILRAGGAYVPIDPEYPDERIAFMLEDLDRPRLLTQRRLMGRFPDGAARVIPIDAGVDDSPRRLTAPPTPTSADDLAYVIYTSGSTGRPKGVMVTHGAIANSIYWMQERYALTPADKVLQKTPFSFDVSLWELFWPLLFGAELVMAEPGGHRDSAYLAQTIREHGITAIHFVPSMLQLFLEDPSAGECTSLRKVFCAGEALPKALQDRFFAKSRAELHNIYGPTETIGGSAWACDPNSDLPFVPIGKPIANTQMHILDDDMRPLPVGTVGELYIGGRQVARGYLNRPELTAERFMPDPFRPEGTLYRTGDLARYLPDGNIEFLGRSDFQVKIRGFRVELGEIEAELEKVDGVRGAVVVARERPGGDVDLVGYVAHPRADELAVDTLRSHLASRLPEYMVPNIIIALERFPLNASGKVDRKALPPPIRRRPEFGTPFVAPRTPLQRLIAEHWRAILDLDRVGLHDPFFELGGTSLQAARFVNQMQSELGETIFVFTLFGAPSVEEYAAFLEREFPEAVARRLREGRPVGAGTTGTEVASPDVDVRPTTDPAVVAVPIAPETPASASVPASGRRSMLLQQRERRLASRSQEAGRGGER